MQRWRMSLSYNKRPGVCALRNREASRPVECSSHREHCWRNLLALCGRFESSSACLEEVSTAEKGRSKLINVVPTRGQGMTSPEKQGYFGRVTQASSKKEDSASLCHNPHLPEARWLLLLSYQGYLSSPHMYFTLSLLKQIIQVFAKAMLSFLLARLVSRRPWRVNLGHLPFSNARWQATRKENQASQHTPDCLKGMQT